MKKKIKFIFTYKIGQSLYNIKLLYLIKIKFIFTYKIGQSLYNIKLLYLIKTKLGVGDINLKEGANSCAYRIRNKKKNILDKIIPIFDKYHLLTSKRFHYLQNFRFVNKYERKYNSKRKNRFN
jgi:hypothetical protein